MRVMSYRCDRCGEKYEPAFCIHGDVLGTSSAEYRSRTLFEVRICERLYSNDAYIFRGKDLCNDCHQKLADWWRKGGKGND